MYELFYNNLKNYIDIKIYLFLYALLKEILLLNSEENSNRIKDWLKNWIDIINEKIIKNNENYINTEYSKENFNNILYFVITQNKKYAGDILEGILIKIFSYAFQVKKDNTLAKNIFFNLSKIKDPNDIDLGKMVQSSKFKPKELQKFSTILQMETFGDINNLKNKSPFFFFLLNIQQLKYQYIFNINNENKSNIYINRGIFRSQKIIQKIYNSVKNNPSSLFDKDFKYNSISCISSFLYDGIKQNLFLIFRNFLISVFIYYQNEHSPLMKYNKDNKQSLNKEDNLVNIPFTYNLTDAYIEGRFAGTVLSPIKLSNVENLELKRNNMRELGLFEMSKILLFNKNIKSINISSSLIKTYYIDFLNLGFGIYNNYTVEEINLSLNYLKEDSEEYLSKLLTYFKGLKTINLSSNNLKNGLSFFFIMLKKLYRKNKIKIENLFLNKCLLDASSLYELGELLKCKYCKLKRLYLSKNIIPEYINFLKKLKLNKTLIEIQLNNDNISVNNIKDIMTIINNTNIMHIYLFKNTIYNFNSILRLIYTTKLIKNKNQENLNNIDSNPFLFHLDLSNNDCFNKNANKIKLLIKIIKEMTLSCLDISHILYGPNPDAFLKNMNQNNHYYRYQVDLLKNILKENKKIYYRTIRNIIINKKKVKQLKFLENEEIIKIFDNKIINSILDKKESKYPLFLKEKAKKMIIKLKDNTEKDKQKNSIINKIFINNTKINIEEYKKIEEKLVNYMILQSAKKDLFNLYKKRKEKKLVII